MSWGEQVIASNRRAAEAKRIQESRKPDDTLVRVIGRKAIRGQETITVPRDPIWVTASEVERDKWVADTDQTVPYRDKPVTYEEVEAGRVPWLDIYCAPTAHSERRYKNKNTCEDLSKIRAGLAVKWAAQPEEARRSELVARTRDHLDETVTNLGKELGNDDIIAIATRAFPASEDFDYALTAVIAYDPQGRSRRY